LLAVPPVGAEHPADVEENMGQLGGRHPPYRAGPAGAAPPGFADRHASANSSSIPESTSRISPATRVGSTTRSRTGACQVVAWRRASGVRSMVTGCSTSSSTYAAYQLRSGVVATKAFTYSTPPAESCEAGGTRVRPSRWTASSAWWRTAAVSMPAATISGAARSTSTVMLRSPSSACGVSSCAAAAAASVGVARRRIERASGRVGNTIASRANVGRSDAPFKVLPRAPSLRNPRHRRPVTQGRNAKSPPQLRRAPVTGRWTRSEFALLHLVEEGAQVGVVLRLLAERAVVAPGLLGLGLRFPLRVLPGECREALILSL